MTVSVMSCAALGLGALDTSVAADAVDEVIDGLAADEEHPTTTAPTTRKTPTVWSVLFTYVAAFLFPGAENPPRSIARFLRSRRLSYLRPLGRRHYRPKSIPVSLPSGV
jgi:hypothetical protein